MLRLREPVVVECIGALTFTPRLCEGSLFIHRLHPRDNLVGRKRRRGALSVSQRQQQADRASKTKEHDVPLKNSRGGVHLRLRMGASKSTGPSSSARCGKTGSGNTCGSPCGYSPRGGAEGLARSEWSGTASRKPDVAPAASSGRISTSKEGSRSNRRTVRFRASQILRNARIENRGATKRPCNH